MSINAKNLNNEKSKSLDSYPTAEPIVVFCAADDKYAMPLAVMARFILENIKSDRKVSLFILDGGISNRNKNKILKSLNSSKCEVIFLSKPTILIRDIEVAHRYCVIESIKTKTHLSVAAYYRLLIAELLPQQLEKAIYLDCDLLVEGDLEQLWKIDLEENYLLAVPDMWIASVSAHNGLLNYQELYINSNAKYFNSGVIVVNLKKWRSEKIFAKAVEYFKNNKSYVRFHDQDILNAICAKKWKEIDPHWNVTPAIYECSFRKDNLFSETLYNSLISNPYIIHFATAVKPWNSHNVPLKEHFFHYVDLTAWSGWRFTFWRQFKLKLIYKLQKLRFKFFN